MKRTLTLMVGIGCCLLPHVLPASDEVPQRIQVTKTEHADLPAGGALRMKNSTGELTIARVGPAWRGDYDDQIDDARIYFLES